MPPALVHLPNGQMLTVAPVFGGLSFKSNDLDRHHSVFPPGWNVMLHSEDEESDHHPDPSKATPPAAPQGGVDIINNRLSQTHHVHRFRKPTLQNDHLFISSISNPSSTEFRTAASPTRQIAMMLWATLWWYFHQEAPPPQITSALSSRTPTAGKPKGDWRVTINREGIFKGKHLLAKLERMGLVCSEESSVGCAPDNSGEGWNKMFVSRRMFWQLDARIYLFTLSPVGGVNSPMPGTPATSRPGSPSRLSGDGALPSPRPDFSRDSGAMTPVGLWTPGIPSPEPFHSTSHLPTYYPPAPGQYIFTDHIRHPIRPKPPRQGETFYMRYIPSVGGYLSFRVASLSERPPVYKGPSASGSAPYLAGLNSPPRVMRNPLAIGALWDGQPNTEPMNDIDFLHRWMNDPRISYHWGEAGPREQQETFLKAALSSRHSFPAIGCWDGKPFGFFELYWVKEDRLGRYLGGQVGNWARGFHCLVGEHEFRGPHRVAVWLSSLVHYCWLADLRTESVVVDPRVDNERFIEYLSQAGFHKEREVAFPHKQAALYQVERDAWEAPAL